jgi:hypothetical protein
MQKLYAYQAKSATNSETKARTLLLGTSFKYECSRYDLKIRESNFALAQKRRVKNLVTFTSVLRRRTTLSARTKRILWKTAYLVD